MTQLFTERQWIGEFFVPDFYERRFCGQIQYSLQRGIVLTYRITGKDVPGKSGLLYGILESGEKCTLVGQFSPDDAGITTHNGLNSRHGTATFYFLIIGDFFNENELLSDIDFSLTGSQEFFSPKGLRHLVRYTDKPIYSLSTRFGKIEVIHNGTFTPLHGDIESQIYSRDFTAIDELSTAFKHIKNGRPGSVFMAKKEISHRIRLEFASGTTVLDAFGHINDLSNLFALLLFRPVYADGIQFIKRNAENRGMRIELYPAMVLDTKTIELSTRYTSRSHVPITPSTVAFDSIVTAWLKDPRRHSIMISGLQNETGVRNPHTAHGEIVLYATQIESISYAAGVNKNKKYEYPLSTYGNKRLLNGLGQIFKKSSLADIGKAIGELRNEIAHIQRQNIWLATLSLGELVQISQYLQLIIIGHILSGIGVPSDVVARYQETFAP